MYFKYLQLVLYLCTIVTYVSVPTSKCQSIAPNARAVCPPASVRCRRCSGRRPRTRRSGRHRGRSAWPLGGWRPRCRTARCLLCERRGALPLGLRLLGVLPRLASRAQRALRARVVPAAVLIVPALVVRSGTSRAQRARASSQPSRPHRARHPSKTPPARLLCLGSRGFSVKR